MGRIFGLILLCAAAVWLQSCATLNVPAGGAAQPLRSNVPGLNGGGDAGDPPGSPPGDGGSGPYRELGYISVSSLDDAVSGGEGTFEVSFSAASAPYTVTYSFSGGVEPALYTHITSETSDSLTVSFADPGWGDGQDYSLSVTVTTATGVSGTGMASFHVYPVGWQPPVPGVETGHGQWLIKAASYTESTYRLTVEVEHPQSKPVTIDVTNNSLHDPEENLLSRYSLDGRETFSIPLRFERLGDQTIDVRATDGERSDSVELRVEIPPMQVSLELAGSDQVRLTARHPFGLATRVTVLDPQRQDTYYGPFILAGPYPLPEGLGVATIELPSLLVSDEGLGLMLSFEYADGGSYGQNMIWQGECQLRRLRLIRFARYEETSGLLFVRFDNTYPNAADPIRLACTFPPGVTTSKPELLDSTFTDTASIPLVVAGDPQGLTCHLHAKDAAGHVQDLDVGLAQVPAQYAADRLYAIPLADSVGTGEPVRILVATGPLPQPFQYMTGMRVVAPAASGFHYVAASLNVGAPGGTAGAGDSAIWQAVDPGNGFLVVPDAFIQESDAGYGFTGVDFNITPLDGHDAHAVGGELFSFEAAFDTPGDWRLRFQSVQTVSRSYYQDSNGVPDHFWGQDSNDYPEAANLVTVH